MSEAVHDRSEEHEFDRQPYDGLAVFHDVAFVEEWIHGEKRINQLLNTNERASIDLANDQAEILNELYGTESLSGEPVVVRGIVYSTTDTKKIVFEPSDSRSTISTRFRFSQLKFIPVKGRDRQRPRITRYHAAFKLLPENPKLQPSYMLLEDAKRLHFPYRLQAVVHPEQFEEIFSEIIEDSHALRRGEDFIKLNPQERVALLDERARIYARKLAPLIDQQVPLLVKTNRYLEIKDSDPSPLGHAKLTRVLDDKFWLAGRLTRIAFMDKALNLGEVPHLVLEHNGKQRVTYTISLDAAFTIMALSAQD